jgi:hypothetical protein
MRTCERADDGRRRDLESALLSLEIEREERRAHLGPLLADLEALAAACEGMAADLGRVGRW